MPVATSAGSAFVYNDGLNSGRWPPGGFANALKELTDNWLRLHFDKRLLTLMQQRRNPQSSVNILHLA